MKNFTDFEVLKVLGVGSYSTCYKVRNKTSNKIFAWKAVEYEESKKESLVSEINLLKQLKHPNIVQYFEHIVNKETKTLYIIMEICNGGDLSQLILKCKSQNSYIEEKFIWKILYQLCKALKFCHSNWLSSSVLHRDIKPANVFLDLEGNVKLGDFGLARILKEEESFAKTIVGTPNYMSPEILKGRKYNKKSDIWSLGCLTYELAALKTPFESCQFEQLSRKIENGKFNKIPGVFSSNLQNIIEFMLNVYHEQRPNIEVVLRHPALIQNIPSLNIGFPKLLPTNPPLSNQSSMLEFSPNINMTSTITTVYQSDYTVAGICSLNLPKSSRKCLFDETKTFSNPELHKVEKISPNFKSDGLMDVKLVEVTQNVFNDALLERLKSIKLHENILQQKESELKKKEQELNRRERHMRAIEKSTLEKQSRFEEALKKMSTNNQIIARNQISKKLPAPSLDDTYCSIEPNETIQMKTIAKMNLTSMRHPRLSQRVSFQSPQKFTKYNIENVQADKAISSSKNSLKSSKVNQRTDRKQKKSIFTIFGGSKSSKQSVNAGNMPETVATSRQLSTLWTTENKKAAFELLAAMNSNDSSVPFSTDDKFIRNGRRKSMAITKREKNSLII